MTTVTRFAPSPTGFLHIGGARTALFNYLYAKKNGGKFLLRIEDTDKKRSTDEAIDAIIDGMSWLGLNHDDEIIFQSKCEARHKEVVEKLLAEGKAYKCYSTPEELSKLREEAQKEGKVFKYPGIWREKDISQAPQDVQPAIRIKAPPSGSIKINDMVQGEVSYPADEIDDMIIMRADGTPTYMLAVVVDDHDMGVTDIIRGDDHLTNTFRQKAISDALGWNFPKTAHIPLIHGPDGAKLSKRHGALGIDAYRDMGYLPEAILNYLASLGWSYGDEDQISLEEAIKRFDLTRVVRSPARFDFSKLNHINNLYIKEYDNNKLVDLSIRFMGQEVSEDLKQIILKLTPALKERSDTLIDFANNAKIVFGRVEYTEKALNMLEKGREHIGPLTEEFSSLPEWDIENIKNTFKKYGEAKDLKMGMFMPAVRAAVCGTMEAPSLDLVMESLGKDEVLKRLRNL